MCNTLSHTQKRFECNRPVVAEGQCTTRGWAPEGQAVGQRIRPSVLENELPVIGQELRIRRELLGKVDLLPVVAAYGF